MFIALIATSILILSCHRQKTPPEFSNEDTRRLLKKLQESAEPSPRPSAPPPTAELDEIATPEATAAPRATAPPTNSSPWLLDNTVDVAAPGPPAATELGVLLYTADDDLRLARLDRLSDARTEVPTPVHRIKEEARFSYGRGAALFQGFAYWIDHGRLLRRRISASGVGPLEVLATDAHDGTRPAVPMPAPGRKLADIPATVAYVVKPKKDEDPLVAKLWVEHAPSEVLTPEGNATHSVSLVHTEYGVLAISIHARTAMTPVHARRIRFENGRAVLEDDLVTWVGGGVQPLTELTVLPSFGNALYGFIPHEKSITEFGIARLDITMTPTMDTKTSWMLYPNGIEPAPIAAAHICGEAVILYAAPETAVPGVTEELVLRPVLDSGGERRARIAEARGFAEVSLAEVDGGLLAAWASNGATAARTIRCKRQVK